MSPLKAFDYQHPGEIIFGNARISEVGSIVSRYGQRCLIVSGSKNGALRDLYPIVGELLEHLGLQWEHFDSVHPNPTADLITQGAKLARTFQAEVILGIGGGSSLDTAKAISLEATHGRISWDYLYSKKQLSTPPLPVVAVATTAGSGSQVNPLAVITNPVIGDQSVLCNDRLIPRATIVDPQLMLSVPAEVTAMTGFVSFCHAFESILHPRSNPFTELFGWEAVGRVVQNLPLAVQDGSNLGVRSNLAWADTLGGLAMCSTGLGLPHSIAMTVGGMLADAPHGLVLASVYRACLEFIWPSAVSTFATLAHLLDPALHGVSARDSAARCPELLQAYLSRIGLACSLRDFGLSQEELANLATQPTALRHNKNNPRVPGPEEMLEILADSY